MTDKDVIKALECCGKNVLYENCGDCPYEKDFGKDHICTIKVAKDALDQINRQQAEIERLTHNLEAMAQTMPNCAKAERAEAIKECLDRIEAFLCGVCGSVVEDNPNLDRILFGYNTEEVDAFIDNIRKEMAGEQE